MSKKDLVFDTVGKETLKSTKNDIHLIISSEIIADETRNTRKVYNNIEELTESIREHGVQSPLHGYREKDENGNMKFHVTHGFRRSRAIKALLEEGIEIKVPCLTKKKSECTNEQVIIEHFTLNSGEPLSAIEKAMAIKKLVDYGYSIAQLSKVLSMTEAHVNNLLLLASAPMSIKNSIENNEISASMALEILRENKDHDKAKEIVVKAVSEAKANGKEKATKKDVVRSGGSKKASKKEENKKEVMELIRDISHKYNVSEEDRSKLERAIAKLTK